MDAYPPVHYITTDETRQRALIAAFPLASFVVSADTGPLLTPLPLILDRQQGALAGAELLGHLDRRNPAAQLLSDGTPALAVFHAQSAYISPADYHTRQLPTYNYMQVHVSGSVRLVDESQAKNDLYALSRAMEPEGRWTLDDDDPRVGPLLEHITAFRLRIEDVKGRFKLSQDKRQPDREAAWRKLWAVNS